MCLIPGPYKKTCNLSIIDPLYRSGYWGRVRLRPRSRVESRTYSKQQVDPSLENEARQPSGQICTRATSLRNQLGERTAVPSSLSASVSAFKSPVEQNSVVVPQNNKCRITMWSSKSTSGRSPKRSECRDSDTCTLVFIAALFTIVKRWERLRCPLIEEWVNKMWSVPTVKHYSVLQGRKFWHRLQHGLTLRTSCSVHEANHKRENTVWCYLDSQAHRDRKWNGGCQDRRSGDGKLLFNG